MMAMSILLQKSARVCTHNANVVQSDFLLEKTAMRGVFSSLAMVAMVDLLCMRSITISLPLGGGAASVAGIMAKEN